MIVIHKRLLSLLDSTLLGNGLSCRNREVNELWQQIHSKDAEIGQLKEHTELLMKQLEAAEARGLKAEKCLYDIKEGRMHPAAKSSYISDLFKQEQRLRPT